MNLPGHRGIGRADRDVDAPETAKAKTGLRIRLGVSLVIASWLPIAQIVIWMTSASGGQAERLRAGIWSCQFVIGLAGVAIAGRETIRIAKSVGWRRSPGAVWRLLRSPDAPIATDQHIPSSNER